MSSASSLPLIPEILHLICQELFFYKKTLVVLARTCKAFHEPALDMIWFQLSGFYSLEKCLQRGVWKEVMKQGKHRLVLRQPLVSTDCLRG
ncbi:hypothetical protein BDQ17DRAFT_1407692, partial [Cyathus striatus]